VWEGVLINHFEPFLMSTFQIVGVKVSISILCIVNQASGVRRGRNILAEIPLNYK
jgi:hypothetical protein